MRGTIVLTGGGSGGHITPILAVAAELKQMDPKIHIIYIGQRGDNLGDVLADSANIDQIFTVYAGKFRRYHGEGWRQLFDLPTLAKNLRDVLYVLIGTVQSWRILRHLQPQMIFVKGGFVGVPVGLAAARLGIPYITHDSDAIPGLANRIIARWAAKHAVAMPKEVYTYPADKTITTGIPLQAEFTKVTAALKKRYRSEITVPESARMLFVIGGGLGAQRVNKAVADALPHLLRQFSDLCVVHCVGRANEEEITRSYDHELSSKERGRVRVLGFVTDVYRYSGAADLVISRAGATNLAEFAVQGKACIVVPNPVLTSGHQLKNARYLEEQKAVVVLQEDELTSDPNRLAKQVSDLLHNADERQKLERNFIRFAEPDATRLLAKLILEQVDIQRGRDA